MNLEFFLGYGWKFTFYRIEFARGIDSRGKYYKVRYPGYRTYIRDLK